MAAIIVNFSMAAPGVPGAFDRTPGRRIIRVLHGLLRLAGERHRDARNGLVGDRHRSPDGGPGTG
jgi:hypothetical protein